MSVKKIKIFGLLSFALFGGGLLLSNQQDATAEISASATCQYDNDGCKNPVDTNMCLCETPPVQH